MNVFWILPIIIPLAGAALIGILGKIAKKESASWNLVYAVIANICLLAVLGILITFYNSLGSILSTELSWNIGPDVGATFKMDHLTWWLVLVFAILGSVVSIYSIKYMDHDDKRVNGFDLKRIVQRLVVRRDYFGKVYRTSLQTVQT